MTDEKVVNDRKRGDKYDKMKKCVNERKRGDKDDKRRRARMTGKEVTRMRDEKVCK